MRKMFQGKNLKSVDVNVRININSFMTNNNFKLDIKFRFNSHSSTMQVLVNNKWCNIKCTSKIITTCMECTFNMKNGRLRIISSNSNSTQDNMIITVTITSLTNSKCMVIITWCLTKINLQKVVITSNSFKQAHVRNMKYKGTELQMNFTHFRMNNLRT